jgi:putative ABC transport system permease protein
MQGRSSGIGAGLAALPPAEVIFATVAVAMAGAVATAFLLARRTARIEAAAVLRSPIDLPPPRRKTTGNGRYTAGAVP